MADSLAQAQGPILFWKETGEAGWLSQWYYHPFRDDETPDILYYTAEHYMMYQKARLFGDDSMAAQILQTKSPRKAKSLGRKVAGLDEATWVARREAIVRKGNLLKFTAPGQPVAADADLRQMLLRTGDRELVEASPFDRELVEASPFDRVWGVGFRPEDAGANRAQWGLNLLGKALMDVRATLREEG